MTREQAEAAANAHFGLTFYLGEEQWFRVVEWCDNGDINRWPEETEDKAKKRINRLRKAYAEALLDPVSVERKAYRTELRRAINMHVGVGRSCRAATKREKYLRACSAALHVPVMLNLDGDVESIIDQLVALRYPAGSKE